MAKKRKRGPEKDQSSTSQKPKKPDREDAKNATKTVGREQNWMGDPKQLNGTELNG